MEDFQLDDGDLQGTLAEIQKNEPSSVPEGESRPSPASGAPTADAASSSPSNTTPPNKQSDGMLSPTKGEARALGPNPTQQQIEQWRSMPKSWRKEMEADWNAVPDKAKQYVHERESQALEGIRQYKSVADKWNGTMEPYKQWFDHYKIDPHDAFGRLATSHIILKYGKPEDRAQYAKMLIQDYGLQAYLQQAAQAQDPNQPLQPDPNAERVYRLEGEFQRLQQEDYDRKVAEKKQAVISFFNDSKNEFAADLKDDILQVL
jgi:hypothetical protein